MTDERDQARLRLEREFLEVIHADSQRAVAQLGWLTAMLSQLVDRPVPSCHASVEERRQFEELAKQLSDRLHVRGPVPVAIGRLRRP